MVETFEWTIGDRPGIKKLGAEDIPGRRVRLARTKDAGQFDLPRRSASSVGTPEDMPKGRGPSGVATLGDRQQAPAQRWTTRQHGSVWAQPASAIQGRQLQYWVVRDQPPQKPAVGGTPRPKALPAAPEGTGHVLEPSAILPPARTAMAARAARNTSFQRWAGA